MTPDINTIQNHTEVQDILILESDKYVGYLDIASFHKNESSSKTVDNIFENLNQIYEKKTSYKKINYEK